MDLRPAAAKVAWATADREWRGLALPRRVARRLRRFWTPRQRLFPGVLVLAVIALADWFVSESLQFTDFLASHGLRLAGAPFGGGDTNVGLALVVVVVAWIFRWHRVIQVAFIVAGVLAVLDVVLFTGQVASTITRRPGNAGATILLLNAAAVWTLNVLVFAAWYWMLDAGGPVRRGTPRQGRQDFRFAPVADAIQGYEGWRPAFNDYLHLAFLVSLSFDVGNSDVLSRRAKNLFMLQALISVVIIVVLVARAINAFSSS
jgi:hypothetical protein